jgi:hypothetical protein
MDEKLIPRLRIEADLYEQCGDTKITRHYRAAADEIERLRAENERLRWSLDPFIRSLEIQESEWRIRDWPELQNMDRLAYAMIGDARRARAALEQKS